MYPGTHVKTQPDKIAVYRPSTGEHLTYRMLDARSNQLAHLLYARGLRRGDRVALFSRNNLPFFDVVWACYRSGLYLTPINSYLTAREAEYIVDNSEARALIVSADLAEAIELGRLAKRCDVKLSIGGVLEGFEDYETALALYSDTALDQESRGSLLLYSSGTTGRPKGILRPLSEGHPSEVSPDMRAVSMRYGFDRATIYLCTAPMYHGAPLGATTVAVQEGGTVVLMDKFDPALALQLIERYRVTHSQWVPTMFVRLLKLAVAERMKWDLSSHRCAIHAAAPCPIDIKHRMIEWWGPILLEYFSATEGIGSALITSEEWLKHPGSVGKPRGRFHICDEAGCELPQGQPGMIYCEVGPGGFVYLKDDAKTAEVTHPVHKNWMTTGDVGYFDAEGYLYLTGRKSFMIISGGMNIYPQQIEDAIIVHPKVADVAVIGVPNPDFGEEVKAIVQTIPGVAPSAALAEEIKEFVRGKLGRQLVPRSVDFMDNLPRLPTGKLYKEVLRKMYWGEVGGNVPLAAQLQT